MYSFKTTISSVETVEQFEALKSKHNNEYQLLCDDAYRHVSSPLICLELNKNNRDNDREDNIAVGFTVFLQKARVDYLATFIDFIDVNAFFEKTKTSRYHDELLCRVAKEAYMDVINFLFDQGLDVNTTSASGRTMLFDACYYGNIELIDLLLAKGIDVNIRNSRGNTAIYSAIVTGEVTILDRLICAGIDLTCITTTIGNVDSNSPLIEAAVQDLNVEIARRLVEMKVLLTTKAIESAYLSVCRFSAEKNVEKITKARAIVDILVAGGSRPPTRERMLQLIHHSHRPCDVLALIQLPK